MTLYSDDLDDDLQTSLVTSDGSSLSSSRDVGPRSFLLCSGLQRVSRTVLITCECQQYRRDLVADRLCCSAAPTGRWSSYGPVTVIAVVINITFVGYNAITDYFDGASPLSDSVIIYRHQQINERRDPLDDAILLASRHQDDELDRHSQDIVVFPFDEACVQWPEDCRYINDVRVRRRAARQRPSPDQRTSRLVR